MARPKVHARPTEELSCGYVMHQHKKVNCKMRWGQLWTGQDDNGQNRCTITLFKFDIANPKPLLLAKKDLKMKSNFEFNEDDFCGLEKGEHFSRHGKKRFICVILKDRHIILQDAIIAMTDTDHDVIGTWYKKITESMQYLYRWRILGSADAKFLHISRVNMCECFTVHNSNAGQKGKLLLDQMYKTKSVVKIDEQRETWEGGACTRVTFYDLTRSADVKICLLLEAGKKLSEVLMGSSQNRMTLGGRFDILTDGHHNLVRIPQKKKAEPTRSLKELSVEVRMPERNNYIDTLATDAFYYNNQENRLPEMQRSMDTNFHGTRPSEQMARGHRQVQPDRSIAPQGAGGFPPHHVPKPAPRHHGDTRHYSGRMDDPKNVTQTSLVDSDYHTQTSVTMETSVGQSSALNITDSVDFNLPYVNVPQELPGPRSPNSQLFSTQTENATIGSGPPVIPPREPTGGHMQEGHGDLVLNAIQHQDFPPITDHPDLRNQGYENHSGTGIAVTISTLLERNDSEPVDTSFGLPYSVYQELLLGLEAQSSTRGDWRGFATELGMTFHEVEQIDSAVQNHPQLYAPQIVLLHWQRAQAPFPCTLSNLKKILSGKMGRLDLANLIVLKKREEDGFSEGRE